MAPGGRELEQQTLQGHVGHTVAQSASRALEIEPGLACEGDRIGIRHASAILFRQIADR
ncbi:MAG: hypothetical protein JJ979_03655 [Roseibium sp.]|nr:hypothetical protein [Roseibium sp.]